MRIAILGSAAFPVPPPLSGGTEWIAYHQAKGLAEKGHKVILFAKTGTAENFRNENVEVIEIGRGKTSEFGHKFTESSRELRIEMIHLSEVVEKLLERKDDYDIILNNMRGEAIFLPIAKLINKLFINVMHLNLFDELVQLFKAFDTDIITISNAQRRNFEGLSYLATVYNGVDISKFPFNDRPEDYLLMISSIGRHKNQGEAIKIAKKLGMRLILAGKIRDYDYYRELSKDIDGEEIKWLGEVSFKEKVSLYRNAKVFLFPIAWDEPFGLVMIEAMSCGTPVVAFNHGAIPEVVVNDKTGYVIEDDSQMFEAVKKIELIKRSDCRKHVEENFTVEKMVDDYEKALYKIKI